MSTPTEQTQDSSLVSGKPTWEQLDAMHTKALGYIADWRTRAEAAEAELTAAKENIKMFSGVTTAIHHLTGTDDTRSEVVKVRELVERLTTPPSDPGWRDISSAPKDGTKILLWEKWSEVPFIGYWINDREQWTACKGHLQAYGGWEGAYIDDDFYVPDLTKWMPLPTNPSPKEGES